MLTNRQTAAQTQSGGQGLAGRRHSKRTSTIRGHARLLSALLLVLAGCAPGGDSASTPAETVPGASAGTASSQTAAGPATITAEVQSLAQIEQLIARQSGKIVVLDLWALW